MESIRNQTERCLRAVVVLLAACALADIQVADAARPDVDVLEDSARRTVLRLRMDASPQRVRDYSLALATPGPGRAQLFVRQMRFAPLATGTLAPRTAEMPEFELRPAGRFRGQWLEHLFVPTHRMNGGQLELIREVEVEIRYGSVERRRPASETSLELLQRLVVNPGAARGFAGYSSGEAADLFDKRRGAPVGGVESTFARSGNWIRIEIDQSGLYRIGFADLAALNGIGVEGASRMLSGSLRIYGAPVPVQPTFPEADAAAWAASADSLASWENGYALIQRALEVRAAGSTMAPGDEILVYLTGHEDWSDRFDPTAGRWEHFEHEYADRLAYWLTWDEMGGMNPPGDFDEIPLRMAHSSGDPAGAGWVLNDYRARLRIEENALFDYGRVRDNWAYENNLRAGRDFVVDFTLSDIVADSVAVLWSEMYARRNSSSNTFYPTLRQEFYFNRPNDGNPDHAPEWNFFMQEDENTGPSVYRGTGIPLVNGVNSATLSNATVDSVNIPRLVVDGFGISYRRALRARNGVLEFTVFEDEARSLRTEFQIEESGADWSDAIVLDTTNPWEPVWLDGAAAQPASPQLRFSQQTTAGERRHFLLLRRSQALTPGAMRVHTPRRLRQELAIKSAGSGAGWQMVILHPEAFGTAATRLRDYRRDNLPGHAGLADVEAVDVQDVYDVFGHGTKDPKAIRNFLKFVFNLHGDLRFVCLIGDASRDYRGRLNFGSNEPFRPESDQLPTWIATQFPSNPGFSSRHPYAADDWFVSFEDPPLLFTTRMTVDLPEAAIGRLPVGNPAEANRLVDRIIAYEEASPSGAWRNTILLAADDEFGAATGSDNERFHIQEAELVSESLVDSAFHMDKLYLTEFPRIGGQPSKPAANEAMKRRWSDGRLIVHYIGHGSPTQLADENLFSIQDVGFLDNGDRLPLFLGLSCDVAIFDHPTNKSMSEQMVLEREGGAIATIAATQVTFVSLNNNLTEALYPVLFPLGTGRSAPAGEALMLAKLNAPGATVDRLTQHNNQKYVLFCDPALRLQSPEHGALLGGVAATSIRSGQMQTIEARIEEGGQLRTDLSGRYHVDLRESANFVEYTTAGGSPLDYRLDGASFFRGSGDFDGGVASIEFMPPVDMRFGDHGRVEIVLETSDGSYLAASDDHLIERAAVNSSDSEGPLIALEFAGGAHRVSPGDELVATIQDSSGINVLGSAQLNSILIQVDDDLLPIDATELFQLDDGSSTRGTLRYPLPEWLSDEEGKHSLQLFASDMLGNRSGAEIQFELVSAGSFDIAGHAVFPNPFQLDTRFVVEIVAPGAVTLEIDIFSLDGRPLRKLRSQEANDGTYVVYWDGRDGQGDELANGAYLYTVRARTSDTEEIQQVRSGKLVRMR